MASRRGFKSSLSPFLRGTDRVTFVAPDDRLEEEEEEKILLPSLMTAFAFLCVSFQPNFSILLICSALSRPLAAVVGGVSVVALAVCNPLSIVPGVCVSRRVAKRK